jgi:hypothetical protein
MPPGPDCTRACMQPSGALSSLTALSSFLSPSYSSYIEKPPGPLSPSFPGNDALPLRDKRVLVTAPRQYATKLTMKLLEAGARPLWLPTIQIAELQDQAARQVGASFASAGGWRLCSQHAVVPSNLAPTSSWFFLSGGQPCSSSCGSVHGRVPMYNGMVLVVRSRLP